MQDKSRPPLSIQARDHAKAIGDDLHQHLVAIAEELAMAGKYEEVLCPHVNEALLGLKRSGLRPPTPPPEWYERSDFKVAAGSALIGLSPSVGGFSMSLIGSHTAHPICFWLFVIALPIVLAVTGFCLAAYGWLQAGQLQSADG